MLSEGWISPILNKWDLFERKIVVASFKVTQPDPANGIFPRNESYNGVDPMTCESESEKEKAAIDECADYMKQRFLEAVDTTTRVRIITTHMTVATDTRRFEVMFDACARQILKNILEPWT